MPQLARSQRARRFIHQTFEIKRNGVSQMRHTLLLNPSDISVEEPNRANVTQTLGGAYISLFGQGLHTVTISGTTGYNARMNDEGVMMDGYLEIQSLRRSVYRNFIRTYDQQYEMFWYDWENAEYYKIIPMTFRLQRSVSEPLLYRYETQFMTVQELTAQMAPNPDNILTHVQALTKGLTLGTSSSAISEVISTLNG